MNQTWQTKDGCTVMIGMVIITLSGKYRTVTAIDKDGYATLDGEVSKVYIPNLWW